MNTPNPKCSCCKTYFNPETKSSGLSYKTCPPCRVKQSSKKCPHQKRIDACKECNGCPHEKIKGNCKKCNGCPHEKLKQNCIECNGCPHEKLKSACIECNGCPHEKLKQNCRECNDALKLTIKRFINASKTNDKLYNRFDIVNFIDTDFCKLLIEESNNKCCYCDCELQLIHKGSNLITIERIDNSIGHIKSNVKIACYKCNLSKVGSKIEQI